MSDKSKQNADASALSLASQGVSEIVTFATQGGPFLMQSNQIAMSTIEKLITLQADMLGASFSDMQALTSQTGDQPTDVTDAANDMFKRMVDRSMENFQTSLTVAQETHNAYLALMEGYTQAMSGSDAKKTKT